MDDDTGKVQRGGEGMVRQQLFTKSRRSPTLASLYEQCMPAPALGT